MTDIMAAECSVSRGAIKGAREAKTLLIPMFHGGARARDTEALSW